MSARTKLRGSLPYAVAIIGGFLLAYLIVAFLIFPSGVIPGNAKVPNVTGLLFDDASKQARLGRLQGGARRRRVREATPVNTRARRRIRRPASKEPEGSTVS